MQEHATVAIPVIPSADQAVTCSTITGKFRTQFHGLAGQSAHRAPPTVLDGAKRDLKVSGDFALTHFHEICQKNNLGLFGR